MHSARDVIVQMGYCRQEKATAAAARSLRAKIEIVGNSI